MPVNDLILIRAGTTAQWSGTNPVLSAAEPGFDTTLQRIKYGNGSTPWNTLPFSGPIGISGLSITPASGFFTNISSGVFANALLHAYSSNSGATVFNAEGTNGSLFSVVDSLSGSLMSVNNNAGLPIFEVFSDDSIIAGRFNNNDFVITSGGSIGIGTSSPISKFQVSGLITANSGNFINSLSVNNTMVSLSGHVHIADNITNFNSSVSGLIPVKNVVGSGHVNVVSTTGLFSVSVTGLQPSGNYSLSGHTHIASNITDFNSATSGLLTPYAQLSSGNFTSLYVTGIPVSLSGHVHSASNITNFNSSVSGLLPITSVVGISGASASLSGTTVTVSVTGSFGLTSSGVQSLLNSGVNINITGGTGVFEQFSQQGGTFLCNASNFFVDEDGNTNIGVISSSLVEVSVPNLLVGYHLQAGSGTIASGLNVFNYLRLNNTGVSLSGHSHTVSDISNFNSSVSGLLPVSDIVSGTGIAISNISGVFTISSSGSAGGSSNVAISNSGVGRLLASDGTSSGIIGQSNLTFINNNLTANGVIINNGNNLYMWSNFR